MPATLRVIVLGQLLVLSFTAPLPDLLPALLALSLVAVAATAGELREPPPLATTAGEAVLGGLIVGLGGDAIALLPYLIVPGFAAGLRRGWRAGAAMVLLTAVALLAGTAISGFDAPAQQLAPIGVWLPAALVLAVLGSWGRHRLAPVPESDAYADAARLLDDFDALTPRLSGGLDSAALAESLLESIADSTPYDRAAVFVVARGVASPTVLASRLAPPDWVRACLASLGTPSPRLMWWQAPAGPAADLYVAVDRQPPLTPDEQRAVETAVTAFAVPLRAAQTFYGIWQSATQQERLRLSREIHDGIAQDLASLAYVADEGVDEADTDADRRRMEELRDSLRLVLGELRISMFDLRAADTGPPLGAGISDLARRTAEAADLALELHFSGSGTVPADVARELTRIAQEALTNVRKHAEARHLWVYLDQRGEAVSLLVADDGRGLDWRDPPALSAGLAGMRERAHAIGATLLIGPADDGPGTVVRVEYGGQEHAGGQAADRAAG